jgi:hypothetical protein
MALDRNKDGVLDGDEAAVQSLGKVRHGVLGLVLNAHDAP